MDKQIEHKVTFITIPGRSKDIHIFILKINFYHDINNQRSEEHCVSLILIITLKPGPHIWKLYTLFSGILLMPCECFNLRLTLNLFCRPLWYFCSTFWSTVSSSFVFFMTIFACLKVFHGMKKCLYRVTTENNNCTCLTFASSAILILLNSPLTLPPFQVLLYLAKQNGMPGKPHPRSPRGR